MPQWVFQWAVACLQVTPSIDLFAHAENAKLPVFAALPGKRAEGATYIDALTLDWSKLGLPYIFPPVQLIDRVLRKLQAEGVTAVMVVPTWTGHAWWSLFREMAKVVVELGKDEKLLIPGPRMRGSDTVKKLPPGLYVMAIVSP